jgi:hypothetical protein
MMCRGGELNDKMRAGLGGYRVGDGNSSSMVKNKLAKPASCDIEVAGGRTYKRCRGSYPTTIAIPMSDSVD